MPICIECGESRAETTKLENGVRVLRQCANCNALCDTYAEMDGVQTAIAVMLLHRKAYRHALFNIPNILWPLVVVVLLSCLLESYVGVVQTSYLSFYREHHQILRDTTQRSRSNGGSGGVGGMGGGSGLNGLASLQGPITFKATASLLLREAVAQRTTIISPLSSSLYAEKGLIGVADDESEGGIGKAGGGMNDDGSSNDDREARATSPNHYNSDAPADSSTTRREEAANNGGGGLASEQRFGGDSIAPAENVASSANRTLYFIQRFMSRSPSLQLVNVVRQYREMHIVPFFTQMPKLFFLELLEFVFLLAVVSWVGTAVIRRNSYPTIAKKDVDSSSDVGGKVSDVKNNGSLSAKDGQTLQPSYQQSTESPPSAQHGGGQQQPLFPEILRVLLRALAMSTASKLGYFVFIVWDMPLYLVVLVEGYQFVILLTALRGARASFKAAFLVTAMCVGARYVFRLMVRSLPPFLASVSLQIMLMRA